MYLPGHLAMGYLVAAGPALARRQPLDLTWALLPALIGAVTPDVIDKGLQLLGVFEHSRALGHSVFFVVALLLLWRSLKHRAHRWASPVGWWIAGIGSHLAADLLNDFMRGLEARGFAFSSWFGWPLITFETIQVEFELSRHIRLHPTFTSLEIAVYALTAAIMLAAALQFRRQTRL